ncbi:MAG: HP0268 family nuclease [Campylobacterota bacterium]|nr:HP0268 family nuclease [Campylobacterota bacterium]
MQLKLAGNELDSKTKKIDELKIDEMLKKDDSVMLYFDRDNSHKDLLNLQDYFTEKGNSFYMKEVKYGLSENEYVYGVHILL